MDKETKEKFFGKAIPQIIHDIRNPLNIIIGFSSILQIDETINDEVKTYIKSILYSGIHIEQLLSNIDYFMMDVVDYHFENVFLKKEYEIFLKQNSDFITEKNIMISHNIQENHIFRLPQGIFARIIDNLFQFSLRGLKTIPNKEVYIHLKVENNKLILFYYDSSAPVFIEGDFFTFEEILKSKRSLAPMFVEKLVNDFSGKCLYLYGKKWSNLIKEYNITTKIQHGFFLELPIKES